MIKKDFQRRRVMSATAHCASELQGMVVTDSKWTTAIRACESLVGVCSLIEHQSGWNFVTFTMSVVL